MPWVTKWYGDWQVEPPKPSPQPWRVRRSKARSPLTGMAEVEWMVLDGTGRLVATFERQVDADYVVAGMPATHNDDAKDGGR